MKNCASAHPASRAARARALRARPPRRRSLTHCLPRHSEYGSGLLGALNSALEVEPPAESDVLNADVGAVLWYSVVVDFLHHLIFTPIGDAFPGIGAHLGSAAGVWFWILLCCCCAITPYMIFQKHMCPRRGGQCVGRCYFWPCAPCSIAGNYHEFKGKWWAYVDDEKPPVLLGQAPLFDSQIKTLESLGVKAIINLCDEFKGPARTYRKKKMTLLWLKTVDHMEPTVEAMHTACSFIEHHRKNGTGVYIHCKSGRGRSAAVAMAWLLLQADDPPRGAEPPPLDAQGAPSSADAPAHPADAPSGQPAPAPAAAAAPARTERPAPPPSRVRSKLWKQRNCVTFYEEVSRGTGGGGDLEGGYGGAPNRTISFATPARCRRRQRGAAGLAPPVDRHPACADARPLGAGARRGARVWHGRASPPSWSNQQPGGVWEVNVAPMGRELAEARAVEGGPKKGVEEAGAARHLRRPRVDAAGRAAPPSPRPAEPENRARKIPFLAPEGQRI